MIAPWLKETLYREWDWRAALRRIAAELPRTGARLDLARELGAAFEHVEPDRRFAIATHRLAGPQADGGRALELALEAGWWEEAVPLAMAARTTLGSIDAMVFEARALLEMGQVGRAARLVPATPSDPRLVALRHELEGPSEAELRRWSAIAAGASGATAADACLVAARLARGLGRGDWRTWLIRGLRAEPSDRWCFALLLDERFAPRQRHVPAMLEALRVRLAAHDERGDLVGWCDAARHVAMRLWLGPAADETRGLARRLLLSTLERAYQEQVHDIPGHLASWVVLDDGAAADESRPGLLPLLVAALDAPIPEADRIWLAALGADICARAGDVAAARSYAEIVADRAPLHPAAREWFGHARSVPVVCEAEALGFVTALRGLEVGAPDELEIEDVSAVPDADELGLGQSSGAIAAPAGDGAWVAELLGVDELELGQGAAEDAVIADALAAVDVSLHDPTPSSASHAGPSSLRLSRRTAAIGSEAAGGLAALHGHGARVAPLRAAPAAATDGDLARRRSTVLGPMSGVPRSPAPVSEERRASQPVGAAAPRASSGLIPGAARDALAATRAARAAPREPSEPIPCGPEQRKAPRTFMPADLRLAIAGRFVPMSVRDLSATGLFAVTTETPPIGAVLAGELRLVDQKLVERAFAISVKVVRRSALGVGLSFVAPSAELAAALATWRCDVT